MKPTPFYLCPANRLCATGTSIAKSDDLQPEFDLECWQPVEAFHAGGPLDAPAFAPNGRTYKYRAADGKEWSLSGIVLLDGRLA
jgi:hypothetical protein